MARWACVFVRLAIGHWDIDVLVVSDGPSTAMSPSRPQASKYCGRIRSDSETTSSRSTSPKSSKVATFVGIDFAVGLALAWMLALTL